MKKKLETITMTSHNLQEENNNLKSVVLDLQTRSEKMENDINELEQYSRRCCLEFKRIVYDKNENTDQLIVQVANKIGVTLHPSDISISHHLAPSTPTHPNPNIIVKFLSRKVRDNIFSKRMKLKVANASLQPGHSKVFINESLTKQNRERFKKCNDFKKKAGYRRATRTGHLGYLPTPKFSKHCIAILTFLQKSSKNKDEILYCNYSKEMSHLNCSLYYRLIISLQHLS